MGTLVSIIVSAYNAEKYLAQTLDSILQQSWPHLEIIVVNDGSTDDTLKIASHYEAKGVKVFTQPNKGQDAALNTGFGLSSGRYIKFMDSDDLINPEMIARQMQVLNGSEEHVAYGEWARFRNDDPSAADFTRLSYWKDAAPLDFLTAMPDGVMLQCGIMLIPRRLIEIAGLWDERLILFNDTEFFTRILTSSKGVRFSEGARLYYRSGMQGSISAGTSRKFYESTFLATNLIADHLLAIEDSARIRRLISNTYENQYRQFYPRFADLGQLHEERIRQIGYCTVRTEGGKLNRLVSAIFGWKVARRVQLLAHKFGYSNAPKS